MPHMRGIFGITESRAIAINGGAPSALRCHGSPILRAG